MIFNGPLGYQSKILLKLEKVVITRPLYNTEQRSLAQEPLCQLWNICLNYSLLCQNMLSLHLKPLGDGESTVYIDMLLQRFITLAIRRCVHHLQAELVGFILPKFRSLIAWESLQIQRREKGTLWWSPPALFQLSALGWEELDLTVRPLLAGYLLAVVEPGVSKPRCSCLHFDECCLTHLTPIYLLPAVSSFSIDCHQKFLPHIEAAAQNQVTFYCLE